jgi:hypothetical protein
MIADFRIRNAERRFASADCGLRIADFRRTALVPCPLSPVSSLNPEPRTLNPSRRRGVSIVEVLFAILITTVGLFGAIAVFPFASAQARRSRIFDMMAVAGRSAFHDFDARGMRRPEMWIAWNNQVGTPSFVSATTLSSPPYTVPGVGTFPVAGQYYCIDPRMIAAHTSIAQPNNQPVLFNNQNPTGGVGGACVQNFPYTAATFPLWNYQPGFIRRITLRQQGTNPLLPSYNVPMSLPQANAIFMTGDDLAYERSDKDKSRPANQSVTALDPNLPVSSSNPWGSRQTDGNICWIATLTPKFDISGLPSDEYILSIVMFHERPNDLQTITTTDSTGAVVMSSRERLVSGEWQDPAAATGGEMRLRWPDTAEELKIRPHDWVLVSGARLIGPPNLPAPGVAVFLHRWYRVADCDANASEALDAQGNPITPAANEMYLTLMGQDWNTGFSGTGTPSSAGRIPVSVTVLQGAFAVFEKTVRLDYGSSF